MLLYSLLMFSGFALCSLVSAGMLRPVRTTCPF